jgi:hypothetical protein
MVFRECELTVTSSLTAHLAKWYFSRYKIVTSVASSVGDEIVVVPGGVKRLPRTIFKAVLKYNSYLSRITDQIRCTVREI